MEQAKIECGELIWAVDRGDFRWQHLPVPFEVYADGIDLVIFEEFGSGAAALHLARLRGEVEVEPAVAGRAHDGGGEDVRRDLIQRGGEPQHLGRIAVAGRGNDALVLRTRLSFSFQP